MELAEQNEKDVKKDWAIIDMPTAQNVMVENAVDNIAELNRERALKAWETRRRKEAKKRSQTAKKAWATRKRNARLANKRRQTAKKAWQTRKRNEEKAKKRSDASRKAWKSRKQKAQTQSMPVKPRSVRLEKLLESMED